MTIDVALNDLAEAVFVRFLHFIKLFLPTSSSERCHYTRPYLRYREVSFTSLRAEYLYKAFEIFLRGRFVSLPHLFIQSLICISMNSWICIFLFQLFFSTIVFHYSDCFSFGRWLCSFSMPSHHGFLLFLPSLFPSLPSILLDATHSSYIFPASLIEFVISSVSSESFYWRMTSLEQTRLVPVYPSTYKGRFGGLHHLLW